MRRSSPELTATHRSHETCDPPCRGSDASQMNNHARVAAMARVSLDINLVDPAGPNETKNITPPCVGWLELVVIQQRATLMRDEEPKNKPKERSHGADASRSQMATE